MICTVKKINTKLSVGKPEERTERLYELTWNAGHKTVITCHKTFEEVMQKMQQHVDNRELYKIEDKAIANFYENNRQNGCNWTGD